MLIAKQIKGRLKTQIQVSDDLCPIDGKAAREEMFEALQ